MTSAVTLRRVRPMRSPTCRSAPTLQAAPNRPAPPTSSARSLSSKPSSRSSAAATCRSKIPCSASNAAYSSPGHARRRCARPNTRSRSSCVAAAARAMSSRRRRSSRRTMTAALEKSSAAFGELLAQWRQRIERELALRLPSPELAPSRLHEALRYSVLGGGKRVRPSLVYATADALGVALSQVDGAACAVELIHAYSLVHDDLPAMDDDELRRGRPTCHKAFDEATAILAGDALQVLAFELLASGPGLPDNAAVRLELVRLLASASGTLGMAGGQALDLAALGNVLTVAEIEQMHARKTGALIHA